MGIILRCRREISCDGTVCWKCFTSRPISAIIAQKQKNVDRMPFL
jgi:hypothetical protein